MKRRAFNRTIKRLYWDKDSRAATASLSRAYQHLEDSQYIRRSAGRWTLTDSDPLDNGVMVAFMAWAQKRELYARAGLSGPPPEALPQIEPEQKDQPESQRKRPGVKTPLDL
jgi:hypothetical protein